VEATLEPTPSPSTRYLFVCQGLFCSARGSQALLRALTTRLADHDNVVVERYWCFNGCSHGPNVVLANDRTWYEGVGPADVAAIVEHATTGQPAQAERPGRVPAVIRDNAFEAIERAYPMVRGAPEG
jgi:(2Fe-2S) ferredoxin